MNETISKKGLIDVIEVCSIVIIFTMAFGALALGFMGDILFGAAFLSISIITLIMMVSIIINYLKTE